MGPFWVLLRDVLPVKYGAPLGFCDIASLAIAVLLLIGGLTAGSEARSKAKHKT